MASFFPRQQITLFTSKMLTKSHVRLHHAPARLQENERAGIYIYLELATAAAQQRQHERHL